jgi:DnaD/phage-associated family protein
MTENNEIELNGVMAQGYGIIPKLVMRDESLSIEAKAIYAYLRSYSGAGNTAFPSRELICHELGISINWFNKYKNELVKNGFVEIKQQRLENGFGKNIYTLPDIVCIQNVDTRNVYTQIVDKQNVCTQNEYNINNNLINNNITNNNLNSNSVVVNKENDDNVINENQTFGQNQPTSNTMKVIYSFYEQNGFGTIFPKTIQDFEYWVDDLQKIGASEANAIEMVVHALGLAVDNNVRKYAYANRI